MGKSTIYRHWRDKLDLIANAFEGAQSDQLFDPGQAGRLVALVLRPADRAELG